MAGVQLAFSFLFLYSFILIYLCGGGCVSVFVYMRVYRCHMHTGAQRSQKRASDSLELELQVVVSTPMAPTWVLETEPNSSGKARSTLTL